MGSISAKIVEEEYNKDFEKIKFKYKLFLILWIICLLIATILLIIYCATWKTIIKLNEVITETNPALLISSIIFFVFSIINFVLFCIYCFKYINLSKYSHTKTINDWLNEHKSNYDYCDSFQDNDCEEHDFSNDESNRTNNSNHSQSFTKKEINDELYIKKRIYTTNIPHFFEKNEISKFFINNKNNDTYCVDNNIEKDEFKIYMWDVSVQSFEKQNTYSNTKDYVYCPLSEYEKSRRRIIKSLNLSEIDPSNIHNYTTDKYEILFSKNDNIYGLIYKALNQPFPSIISSDFAYRVIEFVCYGKRYRIIYDLFDPYDLEKGGSKYKILNDVKPYYQSLLSCYIDFNWKSRECISLYVNLMLGKRKIYHDLFGKGYIKSFKWNYDKSSLYIICEFENKQGNGEYSQYGFNKGNPRFCN